MSSLVDAIHSRRWNYLGIGGCRHWGASRGLSRAGRARPTGFGHAAALAMEHGAAGIITDYLLYQTSPFRTRESLPEPVQLLRMPINLPSAWAISVNYPAAEHLASLARRGAASIWADIRARTFKGEAQNLLADISGTDEAGQIIHFVAHATAGTKPGANCASGPALMAEMGRVVSASRRARRCPCASPSSPCKRASPASRRFL